MPSEICLLKAIRDTNYKADEDAVITSADRVMWQSEAAQFLKSARKDDRAAEDSAAPAKRPKVQRVASYRHIKQLDAQLRGALGDERGLSFFLPASNDAPTEQPRLLNLLVLALCEDEGSSNQCAQWHMLYKLRLRLMPQFDPWHRCWNDASVAVRHAGFMPVVRAMSLCMNLPYGPWEGHKFFHELAEAAADLLELAEGGDDPLMAHALPEVEKELGSMVSSSDSDKQAWLVEQLRSAAFLAKKGPHISMTRWFDWNSHIGAWKKEWSLRHVCLVFLGLKVGYLQRDAAATVLKDLIAKVQAVASSSSSPPATAAGGKQEIQQIRDKCRNGLHVSAVIHADKGFCVASRACVRALAGVVLRLEPQEPLARGGLGPPQEHGHGRGGPLASVRGAHCGRRRHRYVGVRFLG